MGSIFGGIEASSEYSIIPNPVCQSFLLFDEGTESSILHIEGRLTTPAYLGPFLVWIVFNFA